MSSFNQLADEPSALRFCRSLNSAILSENVYSSFFFADSTAVALSITTVTYLLRPHFSFSSYSFKIVECLKQGHLTTDLNDSFDAKTQNAISLFSKIRKPIKWISIPIAHDFLFDSFAQVFFNVIM